MFLIFSLSCLLSSCGYQTIQSLTLILFPVLLYWAGSEFLKYWLNWSVTVHDRFWQNSKTVVVAKTLRVKILVILLSIITIAMVIVCNILSLRISFQIYHTKKFAPGHNYIALCFAWESGSKVLNKTYRCLKYVVSQKLLLKWLWDHFSN